MSETELPMPIKTKVKVKEPVLDIGDYKPPKSWGIPNFMGRQKWDCTKVVIDNSSKEKYEASMNEIHTALENFFEPFAVMPELKLAGPEVIQTAPQGRPQAYPVTVVWFKRPAVLNEPTETKNDA